MLTCDGNMLQGAQLPLACGVLRLAPSFNARLLPCAELQGLPTMHRLPAYADSHQALLHAAHMLL